MVAYEPIWAIGTGKTCAAEEANRICGLIRSWVGSPDLVIQYGGSVKPSNIDELMGMSDIDGVLVGGASLEPESFGRIANYQAAWFRRLASGLAPTHSRDGGDQRHPGFLQ